MRKNPTHYAEKKFRITLLLVCRNESESEYFSDFLSENLSNFDNYIAYDDASSDSTPEILESFGFHVIRNEFSQFKSELLIRSKLVNAAQARWPETDWFVILDSDELLLSSRSELESLLSDAEKLNCEGISFPLVNLWKSRISYRTDEYFNKVRKVHAWRNKPQLFFSKNYGLHRELHPTNLRNILEQNRISIVHLGFSSINLISKKFVSYKILGQKGRMLWRLVDERNLELSELSSISDKLGERFINWFSEQSQTSPAKTPLSEYLWNARVFEKTTVDSSPRKPLVTLVCLIYEGVDWLEFAYGELLMLQEELEPGAAEILFCANDPTEEVVEFLVSNNIPHVIYRNSDPEEHYLSRVYRAYNYAVTVAKSDYCLLVNSDMAFTPGFLTQMLNAKAPDALIVGQLVESGTLLPGPQAIKKNFGKNLRKFKREKFINFASRIDGPKSKSGGLFMPLLVRSDTFLELGSFPEGNLTPDSLPDYLSGKSKPVISKPGEKCVSGDAAMFKKAELLGIRHQTNTDAVAYHFQEGEKRHASQRKNQLIHSGFAIANDSLNGINNERVLWNILVDLLRNKGVRVLEWNTGKIHFSVLTLRKFGRLNFKPSERPRVKLQNATYLPNIQGATRNIALLQDRVQPKRLKDLQKKVIKASQTVITNSIDLIDLDSTSHFVWQPLPVNDLWLDTPVSKSRTPNKTIFVGALDETKGWRDVKAIISAHPKIEFLVVSKYPPEVEMQDISNLSNVQVFSQLSQEELIQLMDTCEFFLLGSPFETQCLAAMEAALRDLAIVMKPTGILGEAPNSAEFGYFSENLESAFNKAIHDYSQSKRKESRKALLEMHLSAREIEEEWLDLLSTELKESFKPQIQIKRSLAVRIRNRITRPRRIELND